MLRLLRRPVLGLGAPAFLLVALALTGVTNSVRGTEPAPAVTELAAKDPEVAAAVETFTEYIARLRAGDDDGARVLWHPEDTLPVYDWAVGYLTWPNLNLQIFSDSIVSARRLDDHVEIDAAFAGRYPGSRPMTYTWHFVRDQNAMVGISGLTLLTRGWKTERFGQLVVHWPEDRPVDFDALRATAAGFDEAASVLGAPADKDLQFYLCRTRQEVGRLFGRPPGPALAHLRNAVVATTNEFSLHEPIHVILHWMDPEDGGRRTLGPLGEAFSYALGGGTWMSRSCLLSWAAQIYGASREHNAGNLFQALDSNDLTDYAAQSAAVIDFFLDHGGAENFGRFYLANRGWYTFGNAVQAVYGQSWPDLEPACRDWVLGRHGSSIFPGPMAGAATVFECTDAEGDDLGDGDYVYATRGFEKGCLDLRAFRVTEKDSRVGFEMEFTALPESGFFPWGFEGPFVRIAVSRGDEGYTSRDLGPSLRAGLGPDDGAHVFLDVSPDGVLVTAANGQWLDVLRIPSRDEKLADGRRIAFSVPAGLIGEPDESWRYQVAAGQHGTSPAIGGGVGFMVRVEPDASERAGGGGDAAGFSPNIFDCLTPDGVDQAEILANYSADGGWYAMLPMVP